MKRIYIFLLLLTCGCQTHLNYSPRAPVDRQRYVSTTWVGFDEHLRNFYYLELRDTSAALVTVLPPGRFTKLYSITQWQIDSDRLLKCSGGGFSLEGNVYDDSMRLTFSNHEGSSNLELLRQKAISEYTSAAVKALNTNKVALSR